MAENRYKRHIIKRLEREFPGCVVLKNDSSYLQGIPDFTVLYNWTWAMLEVKDHEDSPEQPNQEYYVQDMSRLSYAAFVYPENEDEVFLELQQAFASARSARLP